MPMLSRDARRDVQRRTDRLAAISAAEARRRDEEEMDVDATDD